MDDVREVHGHTWWLDTMACDICGGHAAIYCEECGVIPLVFHDEDGEAVIPS